MKHFLFALCMLLFFSYQSFAQWQKVDVITSPYIYSALFDGDDYFVGGDSLYITRDRGLTWQSTTLNGQTIEITALFKYDNKIFAALTAAVFLLVLIMEYPGKVIIPV